MQPISPQSHRAIILEEAKRLTTTVRNDVYGAPYDDMLLAAKFSELYREAANGRHGKAHEEAISRVFIKIARIALGAFHDDNYIDGAAYLAIAAECAVMESVAQQNLEAADSDAPIGINRDSNSFWQNRHTLVPQMLAEQAAKEAAAVGLVVEDPINRDTALSKDEISALLQPEKTYGQYEPKVGMKFKTQESAVIVWKITKLHDDVWFAAMVDGTENSLSPQHRMERMPASAIFEVVSDA